MIAPLAFEEIDPLLRSEWLAHLACVLPDGRPYIVPITYAYDGRAFFAYFADGRKLEAVRAKPDVCVVVDQVVDAANWKSVVAWGFARPLEDGEALDAVRRISLRLRTIAAADGAPLAAEQSYVDRTAPYGVPYRIDVSEMTGRYASS